MRLGFATATLLAVALLASTATAQSEADRGRARELGEQGADALDARDFDRALDLFQRANQLYHAPTLTVGLARALAGKGKLVAALETYERLAREGVGPKPVPAFVTAVAEGKREAQALEARVAHATLKVVPADGASLTLDGQPVPGAGAGVEVPVDPGHHQVEASAPGHAGKKTSFDLAEGARTLVTVALDPVVPAGPPMPVDAPPPGAPQRAVGFAVLGVGAAGVVAGAILGGLSISKKSDLDGACGASHVCPSSQAGALSTYRTFANASTGALVVGGVVAAVGVTVVLTAPRLRPAVQARVGPGWVSLTGSF